MPHIQTELCLGELDQSVELVGLVELVELVELDELVELLLYICQNEFW